MLHLRYQGRSHDITERRLGVQAGMNDREIKTAVARYFDLQLKALNDHVIDRAPSGDLIIRPAAVYG